MTAAACIMRAAACSGLQALLWPRLHMHARAAGISMSYQGCVLMSAMRHAPCVMLASSQPLPLQPDAGRG